MLRGGRLMMGGIRLGDFDGKGIWKDKWTAKVYAGIQDVVSSYVRCLRWRGIIASRDCRA